MQMLSFPVLVVLEDVDPGKLNYGSVTQMISRALEPYNSDYRVREHAWIDGSVVAGWLQEISLGYWRRTEWSSESEREYHRIASELWDEYLYARDHTDEDPEIIFGTERFTEWLSVMYDDCRWDAGKGMMMTTRNPESLWTSWSVGGMFANKYLRSRDGRRVTGGLVSSMDLQSLEEGFKRGLFLAVRWSRKEGSQLYARLTPVNGKFVVRCSVEEWVTQVDGLLGRLGDRDYLSVVSCRGYGI